MKNLLYFLFPALLMAFIWQSCWKDDAPPFFEPTAEVSFSGRVTDAQGQPVTDAAVRAGGAFAKTDENGVFRLQAVRLPARDARLSVNKIGYFEFSRSYIVEEGAEKLVEVQLVNRELVGTLNASAGGALTVPGGGKLDFPAGSVARSDGSVYNGTVRVFAHYIDPTSDNWFLQMPGDLRALNLGGEEVGLVTFGMMAVELESNAGEPLQVASGQTVEIRMPVQTDQNSAAPETIPLWWYDSDRSRWIEEGSAQRQGNEYVGRVSHFTWWNCDFPGERVQLSGQVFLGDLDHPLSGVHVWVCPQNNSIGWGCGHGETDMGGNFAGGAPLGIPLEISISITSGPCAGQTLYSQSIGPFSADTDLGAIIIPGSQLQSFTVSGRIADCSQQAVTSGYARISSNGVTGYAFTDNDGKFTHTFVCLPSPADVTVTGYNTALLLQSAPETFTNAVSPLATGNLETCNTLTEFIQYLLDGVSFVDADPAIEYWAPYTNIYGGQTPFFISFSNNAQTGDFPVLGFSVGQDSIGTPNITTTVTEFGNPGEHVIGSFNGTYQDVQGNNHTVSGSYKVLRQ